ncbi:MAG: NAD(P)/FAD-dependent oxidoreductase [Bacteroidetes bacterium]|nr:NAD(P)/FAD-dependent oxidoreductase [Bacteroidota bacterium]
MHKKKVVIVGGGFGGVLAAKNLKKENLEIILVDKTNHHLFQPLLYQVATAALSPGDIAVPIRSIFSGRYNIEIIMSEVLSVNKEESYIQLTDRKIYFDYLILSPGSSHSYFGKNEWENYAPGLKTLDDALSIREKILRSFEEAEILVSKNLRERYLTFVVVGGGPTGVEMAGAIVEIAKQTMLKDFRNLDPKETKVYLLEAGQRILPAYSENLSSIAQKDLENMGVKVLLNARVTNVSEDGVSIADEFIQTKNIIWAAGNEASPLLKSLNVTLDRIGRVIVEKDLSIKDYPNIFVIGDAANITNENGELLPGIAPVAMQQGKYVAELIENEMLQGTRKPFKYFDKGIMATIGKKKAVAKIRKFEFSQTLAWFLWSFVHIFFLITFRNRFRVMAEWIWYYFTSRRGVRLITSHPQKKG